MSFQKAYFDNYPQPVCVRFASFFVSMAVGVSAHKIGRIACCQPVPLTQPAPVRSRSSGYRTSRGVSFFARNPPVLGGSRVLCEVCVPQFGKMPFGRSSHSIQSSGGCPFWDGSFITDVRG